MRVVPGGGGSAGAPAHNVSGTFRSGGDVRADAAGHEPRRIMLVAWGWGWPGSGALQGALEARPSRLRATRKLCIRTGVDAGAGVGIISAQSPYRAEPDAAVVASRPGASGAGLR